MCLNQSVYVFINKGWAVYVDILCNILTVRVLSFAF